VADDSFALGVASLGAAAGDCAAQLLSAMARHNLQAFLITMKSLS